MVILWNVITFKVYRYFREYCCLRPRVTLIIGAAGSAKTSVLDFTVSQFTRQWSSTNMIIAAHQLTLSDPMSDPSDIIIFLFPTLFLIFNSFQSNFSATRILPRSYLFWAERGWWITCYYPTVLKE
jgi:hypothetical protein